MNDRHQEKLVIPAQAGIQWLLYQRHRVPAFAGTTIAQDALSSMSPSIENLDASKQ